MSFKTLFADKIILVSFVLSGILFFITLVVTAFAYPHLPPFLPIYNKLAWGYARLGNTHDIGIPIGIAFLISLANVFLGKFLYSKTPLLSRFLFLVTLLVALFTFIFIIKLILITL